jgi:threonine aldolase
MIDLRGDTVTLPSPEMREVMYRAEVGDDGYGEDPSVNALEALAAEVTGKEAGLFVVSGTMGNLCAQLAHTRPGDEVICGESCHTIDSEQAGIARIAGLSIRTVPQQGARMDSGLVEAAIRAEDIEHPRTGLIWVEQPLRGWVMPLSELQGIAEVGRRHAIPLHMDGARIFQAAVHLGVSVSEIVQHVDSVMFCLSKDLGAPMGSALVGTAEFILRARRARKLLGGSTRQAGIVASAGIHAIEKMRLRLSEDQENARLLADGLRGIPGVQVDREQVQTNIFFFDLTIDKITPRQFAAALKQRGILVSTRGETRTFRMVTHYGIVRQDILATIGAMRDMLV